MDYEAVDVSFSVAPAQLPRDHAYALFAGLCRLRPDFHGAQWLGIHGISGRAIGRILIVDDRSRLILRVPTARVPETLALSGKALDVAGTSVTVGVPRVIPIAPANALRARAVVIRLTEAPVSKGRIDMVAFRNSFLAELRRQLATLQVTASVALGPTRVICIKGQSILGYEVSLSDLQSGSSVALQQAGLGGKRKFGCGLFRPLHKEARSQTRA